jgi:hypothetical protein
MPVPHSCPPRSRATLSLLAVPALVVTSLTATTATVAAAGHGNGHTAAVRLDAALHATGDPDGTGHATVRLNRSAGRVCAQITWSRIGTPTAAHIHRASDGAVKVDLTGSVTDGARCATGVAPRLVRRITEHPRRYYVNVHNQTYPAGAIQGTLHH